MPHGTRHNHQVIFGARVVGCPRCAELDAGSPVRRGWGRPRWERDAEAFTAALRAHFAPGGRHARGECGPVCTFGDP